MWLQCWDDSQKRPSEGRTVVLLHGMLASRRSMDSLAVGLSDAGYTVINWGYPSLRGSIVHHAKRLLEHLESIGATQSHRLDWVTHSMGGIIARCALARASWQAEMRMVMLAPPNNGSKLTRLPLGPLRGLFPQLEELSESPRSLVNTLSDPGKLEVGVIAASNDFVVDVDATRLDHQKDHRVIESTHQALPNQHDTLELTLRFLNQGSFASPQHAVTISRQLVAA
ncbi:MAG: alpha/beta fold hydrolase [Planctomycetota bacterium]